MKKYLTVSLLFFVITIFSGCSINPKSISNKSTTQSMNTKSASNTPLTQSNDNEQYYKSEKLGVKFRLRDLCKSIDCKIIEKENAITSKMSGSSIIVLNKYEDENIKDSIIKLVKQKNKNINIADCQVIEEDHNYGKNQVFKVIYKIPMSEYVFTKEEISRIKEADKNPDGPITGDLVKKEIYNKHTTKSCSEYANPLNIGTSSCYGNRFLYNELNSKTKFIFLSPGCGDPIFYDKSTIEILN